MENTPNSPNEPVIPPQDIRPIKGKAKAKSSPKVALKPEKPKLRPSRRYAGMRFLGWFFSLGAAVFIIGALAVGYLVYEVSKDLPDYTQLKNYQPAVTTRIHASDGTLLAEFSREKRLFMPVQTIPHQLIEAYLSAEDKSFYEHGGIDLIGIIRAAVTNFQNRGSNRRPQGASTITQQVAKNFLLTNETSIERKIKEALLAMRIEATFTKEQILELYLNEIYLGLGAYGVGAASQVYFNKSVHELTIAEAAYLAALPKAPNNYHPLRHRDKALERRNWVLEKMAENGFIKTEEAERAKLEPIKITSRIAGGTALVASEYFAEEVRRTLFDKFGEKKLYEGGLYVRATLDPKLQVAAKKALVDGLVTYDQARGYRGAHGHIEVNFNTDWAKVLSEQTAPADITPWRMGVVLQTDSEKALIGLRPDREGAGGAYNKNKETLTVNGKTSAWALRGKYRNFAQMYKIGDLVYVEPTAEDPSLGIIRQIPEVSGGIVAMDPHSGRVLAMTGGFSYDQSQFNRATQALRQPGSSIKPFVYAAALDNGYTPSSVVLDAPIEVDQGANQEVWRPENYSGKFYGPQTLRFGLEHSRNVMTVRLSQDMGMQTVVEYTKRFGIYNDLLPVLSMALGAGETTLFKMTAAYSVFANGGKKITPTFIDRIHDRYGATVFRHDTRQCDNCKDVVWDNQDEPNINEDSEMVIDELTAYQMTSIMEGVVQRGTATVLKQVGKPLAGKTGTTNEEKDAWFVGYSPDLVVGVYVGFDKPKPMGRGMTGGHLAAPIVKDFFKVALADKPAIPFRVPAGIKLIPVDRKSGLRASGQGAIMEAFKPGTFPPSSFASGFYNPEGTQNPDANNNPFTSGQNTGNRIY